MNDIAAGLASKPVVDWARATAKELAEEHIPTNTKPQDEVFMSRTALENLLSVAYIRGWSRRGNGDS